MDNELRLLKAVQLISRVFEIVRDSFGASWRRIPLSACSPTSFNLLLLTTHLINLSRPVIFSLLSLSHFLSSLLVLTSISLDFSGRRIPC
ncbi:hypothetical protein KSS87_023215 [Heliosperma pusillum]|nr:hypothetical protein KSS87_023215 [Heliosperma pusillum]